MQNKANFRKSQMNINKVLTNAYKEKTLSWLGKNKANSNPIKANSNPISDYPCVFELAVYNLVLQVGIVMHSMPKGRNFNGEYLKCQMHQEQMQ